MCVDDYLHLRYHLEAFKKRFHLTQLLFVVLSQRLQGVVVVGPSPLRGRHIPHDVRT